MTSNGKGRKIKIFVGIVSFADLPKECFESWMMWWGHQCAIYSRTYDLCLKVSPRKEQYRARNYLVEAARSQNADYMLMLDDDQLPHLALDMIEKFMALDKPLAAGLYFQRGGLYHPVVMKEFDGTEGERRYRFLHPDELPHEPAPVDVAGHGCHWIRMDVFDKLMQPYHYPAPRDVVFVPEDGYGLDVDFCYRAKQAGFPIWLHPGVHVGHISIDRSSVDWKTRPSQDLIESSARWEQYVNEVNGTAPHIVEEAASL